MIFKEFVLKSKQFFTRLIFPVKCMVCGASLPRDGVYLCEECLPKLYHEAHNRCPACLRAIEFCDCHVVKHAVHMSYIFFYGSEEIKKLFYTLKNTGDRRYFDFVGELLGRTIASRLGFTKETELPFECVTYVPRFPPRKNEIGYDQSKQLAKAVGKYFGIKVLPLLKHTGKAGEQKRLSQFDRRHAVKTRYVINRRLLNDRGKLSQKAVLLIDDITTTGATLNECAMILESFGVKRVYGAVVVKTVNAKRYDYPDAEDLYR